MVFKTPAEKEQFFLSNIFDKSARALSIARSITGNYDDALDAVQECLLKCWQRMDSLNCPEKAESWFISSVRNCSLDMIRQRARYMSLDEAQTDEPAAMEAGPEESAEISERVRILQNAFMSIPVQYRMQIYYRCILCLSPAEISRIMSIKDDSRRRSFSRARKRLRAVYDEMLEEE